MTQVRQPGEVPGLRARARRSLRRTILASALATGLVAGGGVAYAFYSASGTLRPTALTAGYINQMVSDSTGQVLLSNAQGQLFIDQDFYFRNIYPGESFAASYSITNVGQAPFYVQGTVASMTQAYATPTPTSSNGSYLLADVYYGEVQGTAYPSPFPSPYATAAGFSTPADDTSPSNTYQAYPPPTSTPVPTAGTTTPYTPAPVPSTAWISSRTGSCSGTLAKSGIPITTTATDMGLPAASPDATTGHPGNAAAVIAPGQTRWVCVVLRFPASPAPPNSLQGQGAPTLTFGLTTVQVGR